MIIITKAAKTKVKVKETDPSGESEVRIGSSLLQFPIVKVHSTVLENGGDDCSNCFNRWIRPRVSAIGVPVVDICLLLFLFGMCLPCRLRNIGHISQEAASHVKELCAFLCMGRYKSQGSLKLFP